jgi:cytosine/adenosine deaminase-related metal-dependent hydrolase
MLEDKVDEVETRRKYHQDVVDRLYKFGILSRQSIAAHGIFLDEAGIDLLAETETIVTHQAQSNMNNAVGRADVFRLLERGLTVGLGTDGMTPDLRAEAHTGFLLHKHHLSDCNAGWNQFAEMTLKHNPAIYQRLSGQLVGRVEVGYLADLILVDYYPPTPLTGDNFWGHFLFGLVDAEVDTTIINGQVVMRHKQITQLDEAKIAADSRRVAQQVWERFGQ